MDVSLSDVLQPLIGALVMQLVHTLPQIKNALAKWLNSNQRKAAAEARKAEAEADAAERSMKIEMETIDEEPK